MKISAIITAHNEGQEVANTIRSLRATTHGDYEIIVIDDASTDHCCRGLNVDSMSRTKRREGVAPSRLQGASMATGDVLVFMDAHHFFSDGCLDEICMVATDHNAIVTPCAGGYNVGKRLNGHGFYLSESRDLKNKKGVIGVHWISSARADHINRCYAANVPYAIPRSIFDVVKWSPLSFGYGGNEASVFIRAYFAEIDVLHVCGPWARHLYRNANDSPFPHTMPEWWWSHALTARITADQVTWERYWWPQVFRNYVDHNAIHADAVTDEHIAWQNHKKRSDALFFRGLLQRELPEGIK